MAQLLNAIYVIDSTEKPEYPGWGCVSGHDWESHPWTVYVQSYTPDAMAEGWVHEYLHNALHAMGVHLETWDDRLLLNAQDEEYESPVRKDKLRPMGAVLQGLYSYVGVTDWQIRVLESGNKMALTSLRTNLPRLDEGLNTVGHNAVWTDDGRAFWNGLTDWITETAEKGSKYAK
jgi:HEXXH motif-containing protein